MSSRAYDNSNRSAAAAETRRVIVGAAGAAFVAHGFARTTLVDVARRAGTSVETVKKRFGTKRGLLTAWFDSLVAGDEGVAVAESRWVDRVRRADSFEERVATAVGAVSATHARVARALTVVSAAAHADEGVAEWWREERARRRRDVEAIVPLMLGDVRPAMPLDQFSDAVHALTEAHTFDVFCRELGWPESRYSQWLVAEIHHLVSTPPFDERPGGTS